MSEPIVGDCSDTLAATISVLCEGLRPEAHKAMAAVVKSYVGPDMTFIAVARRILDSYDIAAPIDVFVETLREFMDQHLSKLIHAYRTASDPQVEALGALTGFFIISHPEVMRAVGQMTH